MGMGRGERVGWSVVVETQEGQKDFLRLPRKEGKSKKGTSTDQLERAILETGSGERRRCDVEIAGERRLER